MTALRRGVSAALFGATLAACAATRPAPMTSGFAAGGMREDLSRRFVALIGPKAPLAPPYLDIPDTNFYCLRSFIDRRTGERASQLYVAASYDAKRDWNAAHDGAGQKLRFIPISRYPIACDGKGACSYAEEFAAALPAGALRDNPEGLAVTFTDRAGDAATVNVSKAQIAAQLAALAAQTAVPAAPAASPAPAQDAHQP